MTPVLICASEADNGMLRRRPKAGDVILDMANAGTEPWSTYVKIRRASGVTDDDFRAWLNLSDKERELTVKMHLTARMTFYLAHKERGFSEEEAVAFCLRTYVNFRDTEVDEDGRLIGEDRPLFWEYEPRVMHWIRLQGMYHGGGPISDLGGLSSMNALVRQEMRSGRL
jgi:hypothetical protein